MYVDRVNRIVEFVYISVAHLMRGPLNPSLVVIAYKGSQTDCLPSVIPQGGQRMFSARKGCAAFFGSIQAALTGPRWYGAKAAGRGQVQVKPGDGRDARAAQRLGQRCGDGED